MNELFKKNVKKCVLKKVKVASGQGFFLLTYSESPSTVVNLGLLLADLRLPSHLKKVCNGEIVHKTEKNPCKKRTFIYTLQLHPK